MIALKRSEGGQQMSTPYVGEVRLVGFNFAPVGWAFCNGAIQAISDNPTLFNLIGTTYGGDGQTTFNLPDLRGRVPTHMGSNGTNSYVIGQSGGVENVTLTTSTYPAHSHNLYGSSNNGGVSSPGNNVMGKINNVYDAAQPTSGAAMQAAALTSNSGGQPHDNMQPYLVLNWIIALYGVYPSQS